MLKNNIYAHFVIEDNNAIFFIKIVSYFILICNNDKSAIQTDVLNILTVQRRILEDSTKIKQVLVGRKMRHLPPFAFANAKYESARIHYDDHEDVLTRRRRDISTTRLRNPNKTSDFQTSPLTSRKYLLQEQKPLVHSLRE